MVRMSLTSALYTMMYLLRCNQGLCRETNIKIAVAMVVVGSTHTGARAGSSFSASELRTTLMATPQACRRIWMGERGDDDDDDDAAAAAAAACFSPSPTLPSFPMLSYLILYSMLNPPPTSGTVLSLLMMLVGSGAAQPSPPLASLGRLPLPPPPLTAAPRTASFAVTGSEPESCSKIRPACASARISN